MHRPLYLNQAPIVYTGRRPAELMKYAATAFLATKITFINGIADLFEQLGADVQEVARGQWPARSRPRSVICATRRSKSSASPSSQISRHAPGTFDSARHSRTLAPVRAYDPAGIEQARCLLPDVGFCDRPHACAQGADAVVIVTECEQFRALDLDRLKAVIATLS